MNKYPKLNKFGAQGRLEFWHGANQFLFMRGNPYCYDANTLESIIMGYFIDTKNFDYDIDIDAPITWDYEELMKIR